VLLYGAVFADHHHRCQQVQILQPPLHHIGVWPAQISSVRRSMRCFCS
jgi:hypothetical protein